MKDRRGRIELGLLVVLVLVGLGAGVAGMPRGHPDWQVNTGQFSFVDFDSAELAARVGSPYSLTRSGRVIFLDSFECGLGAWLVSGTNADDVVRRTRGKAFHGQYAAELAAGVGANPISYLRKRLPVVSSAKIGVEWLVWFPETGPIMDLDATYQSASLGWRFIVRLSAAGVLQVWNASSALQTVGTISGGLVTADPLYAVVKLVVDPATGQYVSLRINDATYSVSGIAAPAAAVAPLTRVELKFLAIGDAVQERSIFIDAVTFTVDEL